MGRRTRGDKMGVLPPFVVVKVAGIFVRAIKAAAAEVKEAKAPDSDGGRKVTIEEALEVVEVVFASIIDDVAEIISGN